ncbi:hypothetical protein BZA05DRAFT_387194 [Tricharina praecox]|uniref:uncharacterized protein n=1 Tax=Tricharina praecox TaxID=43433 RepID=UPI00221F7344|nr:uncharacterized protein BZA05DRAFT_387194 [Tricharina praecox]KAI5857087.1 hypothetical protein BZA05DRAFT_387194 [Tricharina praecox]
MWVSRSARSQREKRKERKEKKEKKQKRKKGKPRPNNNKNNKKNNSAIQKRYLPSLPSHLPAYLPACLLTLFFAQRLGRLKGFPFMHDMMEMQMRPSGGRAVVCSRLRLRMATVSPPLRKETGDRSRRHRRRRRAHHRSGRERRVLWSAVMCAQWRGKRILAVECYVSASGASLCVCVGATPISSAFGQLRIAMPTDIPREMRRATDSLVSSQRSSAQAPALGGSAAVHGA